MHRKTISGIPGWLEAGVADYQTKHDIQSWSQAALELLIRGMIHAGETALDVEKSGLFGNEEQLWRDFEAAENNGFKGSFEEWLIESLKGTWGGDRKAGN